MPLIALSLPTLALISAIPARPRVIPPPPIFKSWRIAYVAGRDVWTCNGDGSNRKRIVKNAETPCWSPDKKWIAFSRGLEVWTVNFNGSEPKRLAKLDGGKGASISQLTWGCRIALAHEIAGPPRPSGQSILVSQSKANGSSIFQVQVRSNGTAQTEHLGWLGEKPEMGPGRFRFADYDFPAWSGNGKRMAFSVSGDLWVADLGTHGWEIVRAATPAVYHLSTSFSDTEEAGVTSLSISRDGRRLAYNLASTMNSARREVWIADLGDWAPPKGRTAVQLRKLSSNGMGASMSPDGRWILMSWSENADYDGLAAISLDGKQVVKIGPEGLSASW